MAEQVKASNVTTVPAAAHSLQSTSTEWYTKEMPAPGYTGAVFNGIYSFTQNTSLNASFSTSI
jgi:hypothetical protein